MLFYPSPLPPFYIFSLFFWCAWREGHARGWAALLSTTGSCSLGGRGQEQGEHTLVQVPQLLPAFVLSSRRKVLHTKGARACVLLGQDNSKLGEMSLLQPD